MNQKGLTIAWVLLSICALFDCVVLAEKEQDGANRWSPQEPTQKHSPDSQPKELASIMKEDIEEKRRQVFQVMRGHNEQSHFTLGNTNAQELTDKAPSHPTLQIFKRGFQAFRGKRNYIKGPRSLNSPKKYHNGNKYSFKPKNHRQRETIPGVHAPSRTKRHVFGTPITTSDDGSSKRQIESSFHSFRGKRPFHGMAEDDLSFIETSPEWDGGNEDSEVRVLPVDEIVQSSYFKDMPLEKQAMVLESLLFLCSSRTDVWCVETKQNAVDSTFEDVFFQSIVNPQRKRAAFQAMRG